MEWKPTLNGIPKAVTLNVGGRYFTTRTSTLMQSEFFSRLFNGNWIQQINELGDGSLFIDRNPDTFASVLDFLRGSDMQPKSDEQFQKLLAEADYFGIPALTALLNANASDNEFILVTIGSCPPRNVPRRFIRQARHNGFHELFRLFKKNYESDLDRTRVMQIKVEDPRDNFWTACLNVALFGEDGLTNLKALHASSIGLLPIEMYIGTYQLARDMHMPMAVTKLLSKRLMEAHQLIHCSVARNE